jgi:hypothetical protein
MLSLLVKQQCGYAAGEASGLRTLMGALRREKELYEFAPIWFETDQVDAVSAELIRQNASVIERLKALSAQYPRYGYRRIRIFLGRDGYRMSTGRAQRL